MVFIPSTTVELFLKLKNIIRPRVYVVIPPPIYGNFAGNKCEVNPAVVNQHFPTHLPDLATSENDVTVINVFKAMGGKCM